MGYRVACAGRLRILFVFIGLFALVVAAFDSDDSSSGNRHVIQPHDALGFEPENQNAFDRISLIQNVERGATENAPFYTPTAITNALQELHAALEVLQTEYFALWLGKWTTAIDWTAAVTNTHLSATLSTLSHSLPYTMPGTFDKSRKLDVEAQMVENEVNKYFGQSTAYYFGEDYFSIRNQAFDDMLWVVLGWLESIQFINSHSRSHYTPSGDEELSRKGKWHGQQWILPFAHRARVFYELAEQGWDWKLCGGGMTWNPRLLPYKNAITNELFISASVGMYLYFPGDDNDSPFIGANDSNNPTYDPIYLANAINGYDWLANSNMTNDQGLYVDGFHIKGYETNHSKTECDERNEMVYTYNQGVVLSGLRGLWEATGNLTYLEDGHALVRNVIRTTGWTDTDIAVAKFGASEDPQTETTNPPEPSTEPQLSDDGDGWSGLGSHGILTELCDPSGTCSQDGQTFKGIFFHHLVKFCVELPFAPAKPGKTHGASLVTAALHHRSCNEYAPWVIHNAQAALRTRDGRGRFGMWWGADVDEALQGVGEGMMPRGAVDWRNGRGYEGYEEGGGNAENVVLRDGDGDLNDRGRGRTVETQGGGGAVVRAMWEFLRRLEDDKL